MANGILLNIINCKNMRLSLIVLLAALSVMSGCGQKTETGGLPVLDLETAIETPRTFDFSEIADKIEFIPLDDSVKESLIGPRMKIVESKTGFYVNEMDVPVKYFDKTGKFISTRASIGRGPNEVLSIIDIAVNYDTDDLYVSSPMDNVSVLYNDAGIIATRNDSIQSMSVVWHGGKFVSFKNRHYLFDDNSHISEPGKMNVMFEVFSPDLVREGTIERLDLGANMIEMITGLPVWREALLADNGRDLFVKDIISDTLFIYKNNMTLEPASILDFGKYTIPIEVLGPKPTMPWSDNFHMPYGLLCSDKYTIVATFGGTPSQKTLIVDNADPKGGFYSTEADGEAGLFIGGIKFAPQYIRDNRLVGYMQAIDIVDNADAITNPDLKALAATLREDSNPVLVIATLKE
jgi:hypothetical protein